MIQAFESLILGQSGSSGKVTLRPEASPMYDTETVQLFIRMLLAVPMSMFAIGGGVVVYRCSVSPRHDVVHAMRI